MNKLKRNIKSPENKKASGYVRICNEFMKLSTERIEKLLLNCLNLELSKNKITSNWCIETINKIHEEESKSNPDKYRGICTMNS